jgi:hypothetical protein
MLFPFCENVFVPVKVKPEILDTIYFGEVARYLYGPGRARFSLYGECNVDRLASFPFYSFLNQFWIVSRLICGFCEAMAGSLSVATTAASSSKVGVVDSGEADRSAV